MWMDLVAYAFDVASASVDFNAQECFCSTARDRISMIRFAKMASYKIRPATSAAVTCLASIAAAQTHDVIIPNGARLQLATGVVFTSLMDQRLKAGRTSVNIVLTEGERKTASFTSDGTAFQKFALADQDVIYQSLSVTVDHELWAEVSSLFMDANENSKAFSAEYDENDTASVCFGDDFNGKVPANGTTIQVTYRTGGGVKGNIAIGDIDVDLVNQAYLDGVVPTAYITVHLLNEERGAGGEERETIDHARMWIPPWIATNGRAVTENDFNVLANAFSDPVYGTMAYAKAKLKMNIPELNTVQIFGFARDHAGNLTTPSSGLKTALQNYFMNNGTNAVRVICTDVEVEDGELVYLDINLTVKVNSGYAVADVTQAVSNAIAALFNSVYIQPGQYFRLSWLYDAVQGLAGVDHVLVNLVTASKKSMEQIGIGNASNQHFQNTLDVDIGQPIVPSSVTIAASGMTVTDDGVGRLVGDVDPTGVNTIDYDTGAVDVTLSAPPALGTAVNCEYRYVLAWQRGEVEQQADGSTTRFRGAVGYPPVIPFDVVAGGGGAAFSDGAQVVLDDGTGKLIGDVDPTGVNRIDYDTGAYDFTFALPPAAGGDINSTYRQRLETPSEDIPIDKMQIAVKGILAIQTE
jgi:hypothetical protein